MACVAERLFRGSRGWRFVLAGLVVAIVAVFVYGAGLGFPFYSDDMYHFRWVETHSATGLLVPSDSFASYRPLPSLVWYLWRQWVGFYSAAGFYALNLLLHVANGWLVIVLALRLCPSTLLGAGSGQARRLSAGLATAWREWFPWAAGLVFIVYPFSYQAVLWVGSLTHLLGAFLILLAVLLYDRGRRRAWGWMVASWLVGLLAPWANEAGLTLAGLVLLYEWAAPHLRSRRHLPLALAYLVGPILYLAIWLGQGGGDSSGLLENLGQADQLLRKAVYFAQGMTFPFQFVAGRFVDLRGVWWALGLGVACALTVLGLVYARLGWWRRLGLACGWVALTVLPPLVALSAAYVDTAPRLLYTASAGVAWLWGGAVVGLIPARRWGSALRVVALALLLVPSLVFLRRRVVLYELVTRPMWQVVEVSKSSPDESFLFVNVPSWAAYKGSAFPVSTEGVALMPGYVGMSDFVWANTGLTVETRAVSFANIRSEQPYWYGAWGEPLDWEKLDRAIRRADRVYVALYGEEEIRLVEAGSVGGEAPASRPIARFDGGINLLAAQATPEADGLSVVLVWSTDEHPEVGDAVFAQLFDGEDRLIGQADGLPLANMLPFWLCQAGDVVRDARWFSVTGGLPPGEYVLRVGLYDFATGARRPVWDEGGGRFADDAVPALRFDVGR